MKTSVESLINKFYVINSEERVNITKLKQIPKWIKSQKRSELVNPFFYLL